MDRTPTSATLRANVNPEGEPTTFYFEYGTTTAYGSTTETGELEPNARTTRVQRTIGSLLPATTYHYRAVARNASGTTIGVDRTFSTRYAFAVVAQPAIVTYRRATTLVGRIDGSVVAGQQVALQARPYPFGGEFETVGPPESTDEEGAFELRTPRHSLPTEYRVTTFEASPSRSEIVRVGVRARVRASVSRNVVSRGGTVRFTGTASPVRSDFPYAVQRRAGGRWLTIARGTTSPAGNQRSRFARSVGIRRTGIYRVFVRVDNPRYEPAGSDRIRIRVR